MEQKIFEQRSREMIQDTVLCFSDGVTRLIYDDPDCQPVNGFACGRCNELHCELCRGPQIGDDESERLCKVCVEEILAENYGVVS